MVCQQLGQASHGTLRRGKARSLDEADKERGFERASRPAKTYNHRYRHSPAQRMVYFMLNPLVLQNISRERLSRVRDVSIPYVGRAKWNKAMADLVKIRLELSSVIECA